jgi:predicted phosphodiesterase
MPKTNKAEAYYADRQKGMKWEEIAKKHNSTAENVRSAVRRYTGNKKPTNPTKEGNIKQAYKEVASHHGLSEVEFKAVLSSVKGKPAKPRRAESPTTGSIRMLVLSDTHIGHDKFHYQLFDKIVKESKGCDIVLHPGDHLEGMSGRPGHIYELNQIGFKAQFNEALRLYKQIEAPIYGIDGNHDAWFKEKGNIGIVVGEELERAIPNYCHLGEWEGDLHLDGLWIKLFHANDGSAYSISYKGQKLVESFTGGEKPHIVLSGHYHKAGYWFMRNVHHYECGTVCGQSRFMRGKKLAAHLGFWIIEAWYGRNGVTRIRNEFIPGFE